jgi:glycosyltransferase involved in cell wall biosynthesis
MPGLQPPRVVIDLEKMRHMNCGLGRFCRYLAEELLNHERHAIEPVFFMPQKTVRYFQDGDVEHIDVSPWRKESVARLVRPFVLPFQRGRRYDLWHVTNQTSKYMPLDPSVPVLLTIHDLNFLNDARHRTRPQAVARKLHDVQRKVDRASAIVTDSHYVAQDVAAHLRLDGKPMHVVPLGLPAPPAASTEAPAWAPRGRFFLTVGNCLAHKNFHVLLDMLARLPGRQLVIAGKNETPYGDELRRLVADGGLEDRVIMPGQVSDGDRQWLYEQCEAFMFPSLAEGFGFPVLEAMQCGKPVFMSRRTSLPEVGGEQGFYWDDEDPGHMADVVAAGLAAAGRDSGFASRVTAHAASFSWASTARAYVGVYQSVLGLDPAAVRGRVA